MFAASFRGKNQLSIFVRGLRYIPFKLSHSKSKGIITVYILIISLFMLSPRSLFGSFRMTLLPNRILVPSVSIFASAQ
jgi:hypothetical protein